MRIFAISGSLRAASSNTVLIRAVSALAPDSVEVDIYDDLAAVPPFNPDIDDRDAPAPVRALRRRMEQADAVLISSPEYAHGVPGVLKNALDWMVGSGELIDKTIALVNASPRATHAYASLAETLGVMSGRLVAGASMVVPVPKGATVEDLVADPALSANLLSLIRALIDERIERERTGTGDDQSREAGEV
jgi:chromate reductase, NAD(P)H dehydrogenase (quinone)